MLDTKLFEGAASDQVERFMASARRRQFARREIVFHEGDLGDTLHIVTSGRFAARVTTHYGDVVTLAVMGKGDIFGELALLDPDSVRSATVAALEQGETLSVRRADFDELLKTQPAVAEVLLSLLAKKVRRLTEQVSEALYVPAEVRVLRRLLELADIYGKKDEPAVVPLMQEELAGLAGTSRATVNRVLRKEEERGTVKLERGKTTIVDRKSLDGRAKLP